MADPNQLNDYKEIRRGDGGIQFLKNDREELSINQYLREAKNDTSFDALYETLNKSNNPKDLDMLIEEIRKQPMTLDRQRKMAELQDRKSKLVS